MSNDIWILWLYSLLWVFALFRHLRKVSFFDVTAFIFSLNLLCGLCALSLYSSLHYTGRLSLLASLYLFSLIFLTTYPLRKNPINKKDIKKPSLFFINTISLLIIINGLLIIPRVISSFSTGIIMIMMDESGVDLYRETISNADQAGRSIGSIPTIIFSGFADIAILLFFYYLSYPKEQRKAWITLGLAGSIILTIMQPISMGMRGVVVMEVLTCFAAYLFFKHLYSEKLRNRIRLIGLIVVILIAIPITYLTLSRFDDATSSIINYSGQAVVNFNEYGLDANGIRYGDRVMPLFKKLAGVKNVPNNYVERRMKYSSMTMDDSVFSTFVGDFTLDFGPLGGFVMCFMMMLFAHLFSKSNRYTPFYKLLPLFFIICVCVQGSLYLFAYGDIGGNIKIIVYILVYIFAFFTEHERKSNRVISTTIPSYS